MCLVAWNWQPQSETPLLLIGNRDEFYARPTLPLHWWPDGRVLAGKDIQAGGTWLGVSASGRLAVLTNCRDPKKLHPSPRSRGELVTSFLQGDLTAKDFLDRLATKVADYNPFNLLVFDGLTLLGFESRRANAFLVAPGVGCVSNADFETPWPKLLRLKNHFQSLIESNTTDDAALFDVLHDRALAPDDQLPDTGIGLNWERALSSPFVVMRDYGTRACSVVRLGHTGAEFVEQCHDAQGTSVISRFVCGFSAASA
jgi:uncharacterized protein with NRDE domain